MGKIGLVSDVQVALDGAGVYPDQSAFRARTLAETPAACRFEERAGKAIIQRFARKAAEETIGAWFGSDFVWRCAHQ